ncbi:hypothetical protein F3W80_11820 [Vibrio parahaemolyticus]|nr:hypothetical protein [Vibrio parahaemolyticus]
MTLSDITADSLHETTVERLNQFFFKIGLNSIKIKCFWDRFNGMTFVEMAEQDEDVKASPDKYRKRFKRISKQIRANSEDFNKALFK